MDALLRDGDATVDDLATRFGVSKMTIHRDLDELEGGGLLRKVRGGASIQSSAQFESDYRYRRTLAVEEKRRVAAAAAALIESGQTVIVDDSSTASCLVPHLAERRPLTVITNNMTLMSELPTEAGIELIALGGRYSSRFHGFFGITCEEALRSMRADIAFLSTSAIHGASAFHQDQEVVKTKRLMIEASDQRVLLTDHTKFGRSALHFMAELATFDSVLTGRSPAAAHRTELSDAGARLVVVDEPSQP
ncbi:MAG: DeoR family transcriptional regulator [Acidimicrobiales bacterium]|nr:MAG: DeoR family transcriptional regulator [Acidimicrobiales bacterium]